MDACELAHVQVSISGGTMARVLAEDAIVVPADSGSQRERFPSFPRTWVTGSGDSSAGPSSSSFSCGPYLRWGRAVPVEPRAVLAARLAGCTTVLPPGLRVR
jgi:hypothetical protein